MDTLTIKRCDILYPEARKSLKEKEEKEKMIRKVYMVECYDSEEFELISRTYYRNRKAADRIRRREDKRGNLVFMRDCTQDFKDGAPISLEWIEG